MHLDSPLNQPFELGDFPQGNASFSYRYAVANALMRKSSRPEHYTEEYIRDPKVGALARKAKVISTFTPADRMDAAEVRVILQDGQEYSARVKATRGNPLFQPLTTDEIIEKFKNNISFSKTISMQNAEKALDMINHLEKVADTGELVALLVMPARKTRSKGNEASIRS
jgi:2-methylcitrate dehydratase PrpD